MIIDLKMTIDDVATLVKINDGIALDDADRNRISYWTQCALKINNDTFLSLYTSCKGIAEELNAGPSMAWVVDNDFDLGVYRGDDDDAEEVADLSNYDNQPTAYDYLGDTYGTTYTVDHSGECQGGSIMVAGGGPNIYIDTADKMIRGYWGSDRVEVPFTDCWDVTSVVEESYDSVKHN